MFITLYRSRRPIYQACDMASIEAEARHDYFLVNNSPYEGADEGLPKGYYAKIVNTTPVIKLPSDNSVGDALKILTSSAGLFLQTKD